MSFSHPHPLIDPNDLHQENHKLLTEQEIAFALELLEKEESAVFSKARLNELIASRVENGEIKNEPTKLPYRFLKFKNEGGPDDYLAIYKGEKQGKALGDGTKNKVKLAQDLRNAKLYILKVQLSDRHEKKAGDNEFKILKKLGRAHGLVLRKQSSNTEKKIYNKSYIVTELVPGKDLFELLKKHLMDKKERLPTSELLEICILAATATRDLHQKYHLYHRDLKLENFMYDSKIKLLTIIDFEFACEFNPEQAKIYEHGMGTNGFAAPELYTNNAYYNEQTEVFALGKTFQYLLGYDTYGIDRKNRNHSTRSILIKIGLDQELATLLNKMTAKTNSARCSLSEAIQNLVNIKVEYLLRKSKRLIKALHSNDEPQSFVSNLFSRFFKPAGPLPLKESESNNEATYELKKPG